jgi:hypothetical protein
MSKCINEINDYNMLHLCLSIYRNIERELRHKGLDDNMIKYSAESLSDDVGGSYYLNEIAYKPTGIVLGSPLINNSYLDRVDSLLKSIDSWLKRYIKCTESCISIVPKEWRHVTIVNFSHYEYTDVSFMDKTCYDSVSDFISNLNIGEIVVYPVGTLLTTAGKILVKCLPADDKLLYLRTCLSNAFPELRINMPKTIHIKICHLRKMIEYDDLLKFVGVLKILDSYVADYLSFSDLYTPEGRITL